MFAPDRIGLILGPLSLLAWLVFVPRGLMTVEAHRLFGILLWTIIWWMTEPIPIPATGLLAVVLATALGAVPKDLDPARTVLAPFADPSVFFLLGGMFLGRAMTRHGLDRRFALTILNTRWSGRSPAMVLGSVGLAVTLVSMWVSNTAATSMMFPVTLGVIQVLAAGQGELGKDTLRSPFSSALLLMTAYASSVGGVSTPMGTATNVVAMGYFKLPEYFGKQIDFLSWTMVGVPLMLILFAGLYFWLRWLLASEPLDLASLRQYLRKEYDQLGPWRPGEKVTLFVFLIVVTLWITPGILAVVSDSAQRAFSRHFPEEVSALLAPILLFVIPINWKERKFGLEAEDFQKVDWGTALLFGAGLSMGTLMFKTGLAALIGEWTLLVLGSNDVWVITAAAIVGGIVLSEFTSNAATASTLIPVILALCTKGGIDPVPPLMGVTFAASFGSALPVSTPPNAIVYSSGLIPARRMVIAGIGLDLLAGVVIWVVLRVAYGLGWSPIAHG